MGFSMIPRTLCFENKSKNRAKDGDYFRWGVPEVPGFFNIYVGARARVGKYIYPLYRGGSTRKKYAKCWNFWNTLGRTTWNYRI